jgi:hypothetical protein
MTQKLITYKGIDYLFIADDETKKQPTLHYVEVKKIRPSQYEEMLVIFNRQTDETKIIKS